MFQKQLNILVVEDNPIHLELVMKALKDSDIDCWVDGASSGEECLNKIKEKKYDAILLDYRLPKMTGIEILEKIEKSKETEADPPAVVMITGFGNENVAVEAMKKGAYDYIIKEAGCFFALPAIVKKAIEYQNLKMANVKMIDDLVQAKDYVNNIMESMINTLVVIDPNGKIRTINQAAVELLGYKKDEVMDKSVAIIFEKDTLFRLKKIVEEVSIRNYAMTYKAKSGERISVNFSGSAMKDKNGNLVGIICVASDMREIERLIARDRKLVKIEKKKTAELRAAYKELEETQDILIQAAKMNAVGQLANGVVHEVKNPLAIILQGINFLEDKLILEKDAANVLNIMKDNIKRAETIVGILADFSKPAKLKIKPEDTNSMLESSLILIQYKCRLKNIEVIKEMQENLPEVLVDRGKMEQVFINIFLNAIQAMPNGGKLFLRSYLAKMEKPKNGVGKRSEDCFMLGEEAVVVEIEDTGMEISKENLKKVFDPFFTTGDKSRGIGLGLSISKNIINEHRNLIEIESQKDKGTKVIITLKKAHQEKP